jgi:hypothetical protein
MRQRRAGPMILRRAGMWAGPMVRRRAGMWVGGMPGLWARREEGRRRAVKRGGGVPGLGACRYVGPSCRTDGVEVCLADGAEVCQDLGRRPDQWGGGVPGAARTRGVPGCGAEVCRQEGRAGMRGGGMPCHTGTSGVPGCRAEACRPDGVGGVVVGGWFLTSLHDGPVLGVRLSRSSRSSVGLAVGLLS